MSEDRSRLGGRVLDFAVSLLVAAVALWGAVAVVGSIWKPLCIAAAVLLVSGVAMWLIVRQVRRW